MMVLFVIREMARVGRAGIKKETPRAERSGSTLA
jgi:hypothetical protein